jgi:hypothetical protein
MIVVADTSPLNYLVLLGHIEILEKIYAEVVVPQSVLDELRDSEAPARLARGFRLPRDGCTSPRSSFGEIPSWIDWTAVNKTQFC